MKRMMLMLVVAVGLFAASAGVSMFMQKASPQKDTDGQAEKSTKGLPGGKATRETLEPRIPPLPSRPLSKPSAESLAQLAASLKQKEEMLVAREQKLLTRQSQIELVFSDIKAEQKTIDALRAEVGAEMKLLQQKMDALEAQSTDINSKRQKLSDHAGEIKKAVFEMDAVERKSITQMAAIYNAMEAEVAAEIFQEMADKGKLDMAVKILASMQERQAARVLTQIPERATVVLMLEKLKGLKKTTNP